MKTKYVSHGPITPHANIFVNQLVGTVILIVNNCRWGGGGREGKKAKPIFCILLSTLM